MDWDDLKFVLEIARSGGVTAAARRLGVNHATVSRRIASLERQVGVRLFDRLPSGFAPTAAGLDAVDAAEQMEAAAIGLDRRLDQRDVRPEGPVTVSAPHIFLASEPFLEMATVLKQRYPGIVLRTLAGIDVLNLHQRETDIAIRATGAPDEGLFGLKLTEVRVHAYAAPAYLAGLAPEAGPDAMEWIGHIPQGSPGTEATDYHGGKTVSLASDDKLVAAFAARAGMGAAYLPCYFGDPMDGLLRLPGLPARAYPDLWIVTHPDLARVARIRTVMRLFGRVARRLKPVFDGSAAECASRAAVSIESKHSYSLS
ncbi:MAG: LysR family transcriptional regulator [Pseudomonadota bacterium]